MNQTHFFQKTCRNKTDTQAASNLKKKRFGRVKELFLFLLMLTASSGFIHSQTTPKFTVTRDGVNAVVLNFDPGLQAEQVYTKVKEWYGVYYKNLQSSIRVDTKNTLLKIGAFKEKAWKIRDNNFDHWYDLEYTLTIEIKDGKCRVTFASPEDRYKVWFAKDGTTLPKFKDSKATFEASINEPITSLYKYIKEPKKVNKDDW